VMITMPDDVYQELLLALETNILDTEFQDELL